jgi:nicotinate phosphoribosyltransferase
MKFNFEQAMEREQGPIITSILDLDHYKPTMGQFVFHRYADVPVKYAAKNRTKKVKLAEIVDEKDLRRELDHVQQLKPTEKEIAYLRTLRNNGSALYQEDYLNFFKDIQMPAYKLEKKEGQYQMEFVGPWAKSIYWETLALSIENELYYRALMKNMTLQEKRAVYAEGEIRLEEKIKLLNENPFVRFIEFGTRRRFSGAWQDYIVTRMKQDLEHNQMIGTSNVALAMKYGLAPKGTMAHELFMVMSGVMHKNDDEIRSSHNQVLQEWWQEYGKDLSIALTDTYGSEFFFKDMTQKQAEDYIGLRQDSGNPTGFANRQIRFYQEKQIDERKKIFVPSDGLEVKSIIGLQNHFYKRILQTAGWGTSLTNDLGFPSLSLVVKAIESCGYGTVKLSDNPEKGMGEIEDRIRFMRIFEYDPAKYKAEECKY